MKGPETRLRKRIVKALTEWYPEGYFRKIHGNAFQNIGVPDLLCCIDGRFFGLEIKNPGKHATPAQMLEMEKIRKAHGLAAEIDSVQGALDFVKGGLSGKNLRGKR